MLERSSFIEVMLSPRIVVTVSWSPLTSIVSISPLLAIATTSLREICCGPPTPEKRVKKTAITATTMRRYMKLLRIQRGFIRPSQGTLVGVPPAVITHFI